MTCAIAKSAPRTRIAQELRPSSPACAPARRSCERARGPPTAGTRRGRSRALELPACGAEGVTDRDVEVLVSAIERMIATHHDVRPGHRQRDSHMEPLSLVLVLVRALDEHVAALDAWMDLLEPGRPALHEPFDGGSLLHVSKRDAQWNGHARMRCTTRAGTRGG